MKSVLNIELISVLYFITTFMGQSKSLVHQSKFITVCNVNKLLI